MRLAVFAEYLPPKLGSDRRIFEIMKRLASKHEVHFIVFPPFRELRTDLSRNAHMLRGYSLEQHGTVKCEGINGHLITIPSGVALLWKHSLVIAYCLTAMTVFLKSVAVVKKISPEVIVLNYPSPYTGLLGFLVGKLMGKHVVVDFNDLIAQYTSALLNLGKGSFTSRLLTLIQDYIVGNSEKVIAPTLFVKDHATSLGVPERKIAVIPNGVDTRSFDPNRPECISPRKYQPPNGDRLCAYCGRLDEWAGINIVSKLSQKAMGKELPVKFLLAGSGGGEVVERENVIYVGEIPYEGVPGFLAAADVVLIPFPDNEVSHAASPLKLFEGMSMRKPVIASRVSGIEEVIVDGENGLLADPDSIEEWLLKLQVILESETLASSMGACARKTVERRYDWAVLANRYEEILNAVCPE